MPTGRRISRVLKPCCAPKLRRHRYRYDLLIGPPGDFVAMAVEFLMMLPAQGYGKFIADLASERSRLSKFEMMCITGCPLTDQAALCGDEREMRLVALAERLAQRRDRDLVRLHRGSPLNCRRSR